jgi:hypothetical protein
VLRVLRQATVAVIPAARVVEDTIQAEAEGVLAVAVEDTPPVAAGGTPPVVAVDTPPVVEAATPVADITREMWQWMLVRTSCCK